MSTEAVMEYVQRAAEKVARDWPGVVDADEVEQEIWVKLLESATYVQQIIDMDPGRRTESLRLIGHQIASGYRNEYEVFTGNVFYGVEDVRSLLKSGILTDSQEDLTNGSETLTAALDVRDGMSILAERNPRHTEAIWSEYVTGDYDKTTSTARDMLSRALVHLTTRMNQANRTRYAMYDNGPGTRRVTTNSAASVTKSRDYSGRL